MTDKLVLCMIVKNENGIIKRCIESTLRIIDAICITDTGSTDDTVEIIKKVGEEAKIPTKVPVDPFKSFGHNRTVSRQNAVEFVKELGWDLKKTFILHLDADMVLEISQEFNKSDLIHPGYNIIQYNPSMSYANHRLDRCDTEWKCIGRTHEYWSGPATASLGTLKINDRNDGQSKGDKFPRDIRLLDQDIKEGEETGNKGMISRSLFYKAQTQKDMGDFEGAIKTYRQHLTMPTWDEEAYYAQYAIGLCYYHSMQLEDSKEGTKKLVNFDHAVSAFLEAWNMRPHRAESLHKLAQMYRELGKNRLCWVFADLASKIPYPNDLLFVHRPIYEYELNVEKSIVGFYLGENVQREGARISDQLIFDPKVPDQIKVMVHRNMTYYAEARKLKVEQKIPLSDIKKPLLFPDDAEKGTYNTMNPSIIKYEGKYVVNVRLVNYKQERGVYTYLDGSGQIRTKNKLVTFNEELKKIGENYLIDNFGNDSSTSVVGLEDVRLVEHSGGIYFTTSTRINRDAPQIALCRISKDLKGGDHKLDFKTLLIGPQGPDSPCEKNWLPYSDHGELKLIYSHCPLTLLRFNPKNRSAEIVRKEGLKYDFSRFRGSGAPIKFKWNADGDPGYISIVHEVHDREWRTYTHRFVFYDADMTPKGVTSPFIFFNVGIEYVCGFTQSFNRKHFLITLGVNDAEAYLVRVDVDYVKSLIILLK